MDTIKDKLISAMTSIAVIDMGAKGLDYLSKSEASILAMELESVFNQETKQLKEQKQRLSDLIEVLNEYIEYLGKHSATYESVLSSQSWWDGLSESILQEGEDFRQRIKNLKDLEPTKEQS